MSNDVLDVILQEDLACSVPHILDHQGNQIACRETELRILRIAQGLRSLPNVAFLPPVVDAARLDALIARVHAPEYVQFLSGLSKGLPEGETVMFHPYIPDGIAPDTPIVPGIYAVARDAARTAVAAADRVAAGSRFCYGLCRPPGHHAGRAFMGGHCYLNNAAIAVATLRQAGFKRLAVIDVDFHFGNGTSELLANWTDVFFGSIHSCTTLSYPYKKTCAPHKNQLFLPFADDPGREGFLDALDTLLQRAIGFAAEAIVVSIGYDIIAGDPFGKWNLHTDILEDIGNRLAASSLPLCMVQEGGYLPEHLDECAYRLGRGLLCHIKPTAITQQHPANITTKRTVGITT